MYTHTYQLVKAGKPAASAKGALIMLHGRGSSAANIVGLAGELHVEDMAIYAPQATNNSWYPYSFMAGEADNQPALNAALDVMGKVVDEILTNGIQKENIYFLGFSQGACLTLEYVARKAGRFGGIVAFTGGLIGKKIVRANYQGDFENTPVLLTTGDPDMHIPLSRAEESAAILKEMGAAVTFKVYKGRPHTILKEEIQLANSLIFGG